MNENKFDGKGTAYANGRPGYPAALFKYLQRAQIVTPCTIAADIGAGTGIFTRQLSAIAEQVYAVEPNDGMRQMAEKCLGTYKNIISVRGSAEHTTLLEHSVDVVTAAQAFHWFDRMAFKQECKRILKTSGYVVLVWNDRDTTCDIIEDNFAVNRKFCSGFKGSSNGMSFSNESFSGFFEGNVEVKVLKNNLLYDCETFLSRNLSSSYAPKREDERYSDYIHELEGLFQKYSRNGVVEYPYLTRCYIGKV